MKYLKSLPILSLSVSAALSSIEKSVEKICSQAETSYPEVYTQYSNGEKPVCEKLPGPRTGGGAVQFGLTFIENYGCWCYLDKYLGKSKPVDLADTYCRALHDGYSCIDMDEELAGNDCTAIETDYEVTFFASFPVPGNNPQIAWTFNCDSNTDSCSKNTCIVESTFILNFYNDFTWNLPGNYAISNLHSEGFIPNQANCPTIGGGPAIKDCCGEHPTRKPFNTGGLLACCPDGKVRLSSAC